MLGSCRPAPWAGINMSCLLKLTPAQGAGLQDSGENESLVERVIDPPSGPNNPMILRRINDAPYGRWYITVCRAGSYPAVSFNALYDSTAAYDAALRVPRCC